MAPVVEKGARQRNVYLTQGIWRDAFDLVRAQACCIATHRTPLNAHKQTPQRSVSLCKMVSIRPHADTIATWCSFCNSAHVLQVQQLLPALGVAHA